MTQRSMAQHSTQDIRATKATKTELVHTKPSAPKTMLMMPSKANSRTAVGCPVTAAVTATATAQVVRDARKSARVSSMMCTHLHWPMTTVSPSLQRKAGEMCALMLVWRFSYLDTNKHSHTAADVSMMANWGLQKRGADGPQVALPQTGMQPTQLIGLCATPWTK